MADIKITDLTAYTDPLNTDVLPIVDVTSDTTKKVSIANLLKNASSGTAAAPGIAFDGDNTGIYRPGADELAVATNGTGRLFIDSSGRLLVGTSSALSVNSITAGVEVHASTTNNGASISVARFNNNSFGPRLNLGKSRNSTIAAGTIVQNGDDLGGLFFNGDDGTDLNTAAASIKAFVDGTPGADDMPGRLVFSTTADGASSPTERVRLDSTGRLLVGTSSDSGGALLQVGGDRIRVGTAKTPASASDTGTAGEICWDASYIYVCIATNTWKRTAISTW